MNAALSIAALEKLTAEINTYHESQGLARKSLDEVAYGFVKVGRVRIELSSGLSFAPHHPHSLPLNC